jgi:hypothetical protein
MTEQRPLAVNRKDGVLVPKQKWLFDPLFAEGNTYEIELHEPRSTKSHNHYFAAVHEAWKNLPDHIAERHPDSEHLRKFALIKTGWSVNRTIVCESAETAHAVAAAAGSLNESAVVVVQGKVVTIAVARSQKTSGPGAMLADEFHKSKQDVLDYVAGLIGVDPATLSAQVSNSSDGPSQASDRTDTPAASTGIPRPSGDAAGVQYIDEASLLPPDWRDTYVTTMTGPTTRAMSIHTRDHTALQMYAGAKANDAEREWMRRVATLTVKRDRGKLKTGEFEAELERLKAISLAEMMGAKDAA